MSRAERAIGTSLAPDTLAAAVSDALTGLSLVESVEELARTWLKRSWRAPEGRAGAAPTTPEELARAAAEHGVSVRYERRSLASLQPGDFPCVALTKDGRGLILAQRQGDRFNLWRRGESETVPAADVEERHAGVVFFATALEPAEAEAEAPEDKGKGLPRWVLREVLRRHRPALLQLGLAAFAANLFMVALPIFSMAVYDRVVPHLAYETLWALSIGVAIVLAADMALRHVRLKLADAVSLSLSTELQGKLYGHILTGRLGRHGVATGTLSNALRDVEALCGTIPALLVSLAIDLPWFVAISVLIYFVAGGVAWTPFLGVLLLGLVHLASHATSGRTRAAAKLAAALNNQASETLQGLPAIKATTAEAMLQRRWDGLADDAAFAAHRGRLAHASVVQASVVIGQAMIVVALIIGVYEMGEHSITVGGLSAATLLVGRMMGPASQMLGLVHRVSELSHAMPPIEAILASPQEGGGDAARSGRAIGGRIELRDVGLTYPGEKRAALEAITLTIEPGERIGIVGRVGCGKSSLLRLMLRLYEPSEGTISLDGHDIRQYPERQIRSNFGYMAQDAVLFDDTLNANLHYGLDGASQANFDSAVALAGVRDFAARHPEGYGMRVGPRGERLSGGERQAVALARALMAQPKTLILDEPTAAMDSTLEARIVRELGATLDGRTLILSTHRAPLLALVDRLLWMEEGRLIADGPKAAVLARIQSGSVPT